MNTALKDLGRAKIFRLPQEEKLRNDNLILFRHYLSGQKRLDEIAEGIRYASHIQSALFSNEATLREILSDSFMFSLPKDELNGDFVWTTRWGNKIIIAVADCTGHGIPGAMMSILGISLLNQVVLEERCYEPSFILRRMDERLRITFDKKPGSRSSYDGMDMSVSCIDYSSNSISYAGAMRSMWLMLGNELEQIAGARYPLGGLRLEENRNYPVTEIKFTRGDMLYLFTDGYSDQFGGPHDKKMGRGRLRKLVHLIKDYNITQQKEQILEFFLLWKGSSVQTDDVTFVGVRL